MQPRTITAPRQMTLANVGRGKTDAPLRVLLYGVEGVGKSTFAAGAPAPIFVGPEDGVPPALADVPRFHPPTGEWSWQDALDAIHALTVEQHTYAALAIDTLDWLEPLCWRHICARDGQPSIESYGYGKGYVAALDEWRVFLASLEKLRAAKPMHVVLLAHSWIKAFKDPESDGYDRYQLKLHDKAAGLLKEWSDMVLFSNHETCVHVDAKTKRARGIGTGARLIYTQRRAAFDAKNRHDLPETLPLAWEDLFAATRTRQVASPDELRAAIIDKIPLLGDRGAKATAALERAGSDAVRLAQLNDWCNAYVTDEKGAAQ
ncbi:MAG: ATP-binding protein [Pseudomonadota bacterium]